MSSRPTGLAVASCVRHPQPGYPFRLDCTVTYRLDDAGLIPCGRAAVAGSGCDFRRARPVGPTVLDTAFTDLVRDLDGLARVRLSRPDGRQVTVWADGTWTHFQVFTGETLPERQRRRSLAVEPMSCPPNAFASGDGLTLLAPGATLAGTWGISAA